MGEVKIAGKGRGYVGAQGFKGFRKQSTRAGYLIELRTSRARWISVSVF